MQERYRGHIHSWYICQSLKRFQNILIRYCFVFLASRALAQLRLVGILISSASILILYLIIRKATRPRPGGLAPLHLQNRFFVKNKARFFWVVLLFSAFSMFMYMSPTRFNLYAFACNQIRAWVYRVLSRKTRYLHLLFLYSEEGKLEILLAFHMLSQQNLEPREWHEGAAFLLIIPSLFPCFLLTKNC